MGWKSLIGAALITVSAVAEDTNPLKTIEKGAFSGIQEALQVVVTNKTQWAELWAKHIAQKDPKTPPPEINFDKESVIFVAMGRKRTGGYGIEISDIRRAGEKAEVVISTREPKPGGFNIQALTAPFHIVAVPRVEKDVTFKTADNKKGS